MRIRSDEISIGDLLMTLAVWILIVMMFTALGGAALLCAAIDACVNLLFKPKHLKANYK